MSRTYYKSESNVYDELTEHFYEGVTMKQLIEVAEAIAKKLEIKSCSRTSKRAKRELIRWYERNWSQIKDLVLSIVPIDENGNEISSFERKKPFLWKFSNKLIIPSNDYEVLDQMYCSEESNFDMSDDYGNDGDGIFHSIRWL